jgi:uncharacterized membrane protein YcaP (DUF421 family)
VEILGRVALIYVLLTLAFRALGKRELNQLSPFELVMLLMIAEVVSPALTAGDDSLTGAIVGATTLLCLAYLHSVLSYRFKWFQSATESPAAVIIAHGRVLEFAMHKERVRPDELFSEMHKSGIEDLSHVKWGILEPDGKMSFVRCDDGDTSGGNEARLL